jgi:hypothetical protein
MSRDARTPATDEQLEKMSFDELNAKIQDLEIRILTCGSSATGKDFRRERENIQRLRMKRFGK